MVTSMWQRGLSESRRLCARCVRNDGRISKRALYSTDVHPPAPGRLFHLLTDRGLVNQIAGNGNVLQRVLETRRVGVYAGVDPTAPSLHLGHLLPLMVLFWMYIHGHNVITLVGGATARIGDPSGRQTPRAQTLDETRKQNLDGIWGQMELLWTNATAYLQRRGYERTVGTRRLLNNASWLEGLSALEFLQVLGSGTRIGAMLGRDTIKKRLQSGAGVSFAEFSYPLLQGWDWWHMYQAHDVQLQIGGSDQYGNLVAGINAVEHIASNQVRSEERAHWLEKDGSLKEDFAPMGLTVPLLTTSTGEKYGKSAGNAVWLDSSLTSPFDLYGLLLRSPDSDVERYLKLLTLVPLEEISATMKEHSADPGKRRAQHLLAREVLELVHGQSQAQKTQDEHHAMRRPTLASIAHTSTNTTAALGGPMEEGKRVALPRSHVLNQPLSRVLVHAGLVGSNSEGTRAIAKGGVYVAVNLAGPNRGDLSFVPVAVDQRAVATESMLLDGLLVLRMGKWKVRVIEVAEN